MTASRFNFRAYVEKINKIVNVEILHPEYVEDYDGNLYTNFVLMQSTGLVDKNGKEIFEGDIVRVIGDDLVIPLFSTVEWDEKNTGFIPMNKHDCRFSCIRMELLEVVGNIYENKKLLEEVENGSKVE